MQHFKYFTVTHQTPLFIPILSQLKPFHIYILFLTSLVKVLCYKSEGRWFDSR